MPRLHDTLGAFHAAVLRGDPAIAPQVATGPFTAQEHLQLYRNNVFVSLTDALGAIYEVVQRLVGADFFATACRHYIPDHPPAAANLHAFGAGFPAFLESYAPAMALPYLAEVARLEWLWHEAFHAADADALDPAVLAGIAAQDHARIVFALHPALRLLYSRYPVHRIWQVNQENYRGDDAVSLDEGEAWLLIKRPRLEVAIETLDRAEWEFLHALREGRLLEEALDRACRHEARFDLAQVLQRRFADATLTDASVQ
jgi:hypothetical protein